MRVVAEQHVKSRLECYIELPNIPEVTQFELGQVHAALCVVADQGSSGKQLKAVQRPDFSHQL